MSGAEDDPTRDLMEFLDGLPASISEVCQVRFAATLEADESGLRDATTWIREYLSAGEDLRLRASRTALLCQAIDLALRPPFAGQLVLAQALGPKAPASLRRSIADAPMAEDHRGKALALWELLRRSALTSERLYTAYARHLV